MQGADLDGGLRLSDCTECRLVGAYKDKIAVGMVSQSFG